MDCWKTQKREQLIGARQDLTQEIKSENQSSILSYLQQLLETKLPSTLGLYWPIKGEVDCRPLAGILIKQGWELSLPVINQHTNQLDFAVWTPQSEMQKGVWNIPIPKSSQFVKPNVLLIPLVGFDSLFYRLGYGGGYYDRTLEHAGSSILKIGVGLEEGRLASIHPHEFDIQMDVIVTEYSCKTRDEVQHTAS